MKLNDNMPSPAQIEESPASKFREQFSHFYKSPDFTHFAFYDDIQGKVMGVMEIDDGGLSFLTNHENLCHCLKLTGIYVHKDSQDCGLFRQMIDSFLSLTEEHNVFTYLCARAYRIAFPLIQTPDQFIHFIGRKNEYFRYYHNKSQERLLSSELMKTYQKFGFCHLLVDKDDVGNPYWRKNILCRKPKNIHPELEEALEGRVFCDDEEWKDELVKADIFQAKPADKPKKRKKPRKPSSKKWRRHR